MDTPESIGVYGEAKAEYTRQLCSFLVPALETYFLDVLANVKETEKDTKRVLWVFQDSLKQFPDWNIDKVQRETEKIQKEARCDYLEEILTAVFIAHTKVLSAIRLTSKQKKLQITIPKLDHFLHRTMSECARLLWSNAYLFSETGPAIERQKNLRQVEQLLHEGVLQSIRGMLPVKSILKEYLADDGEEGLNETAAETAETAAETAEAEAEAKEEEVAPVIHEENAPVDVSGAVIVEKEEKKEESVIEPPVEPIVEKTEEKPVVEQASVPSVPTIVVDTEPLSVGFTQMDAVLDTDNPDKTTIQASSHSDEEEEHEITHIEVDTSVPPEPLDEFEDLEERESIHGMDEDEFETL